MFFLDYFYSVQWCQQSVFFQRFLNCKWVKRNELNIIKDVLTFLIISWICFNKKNKTRFTMEQPYTLSILYFQYHSCWWPRSLRSQGISRHGIGQISRNIPSLASEELINKVKPSNAGGYIKNTNKLVSLEVLNFSISYTNVPLGLNMLNLRNVHAAAQSFTSSLLFTKIGITVKFIFTPFVPDFSKVPVLKS